MLVLSQLKVSTKPEQDHKADAGLGIEILVRMFVGRCEMAKVNHRFSALVVALTGLAMGQHSVAGLHIVMPERDDIELSEQEKGNLAISAAELIPNPTETLLESIDSADGLAWIDDQRNEPEAQHPLRMTINFPEVSVDENRKLEPKFICEGSYDPLVWNYCRETSRWSLKVAGYNYVRINHESITLESIAEMYASLDSAELESPTGAAITSQGAHHILFNWKSELYNVIGRTTNGEQYFTYLRPVEGIYGVRYEVAEWSCR